MTQESHNQPGHRGKDPNKETDGLEMEPCLGAHIYECNTVQLGSCGCPWPLTVTLTHAQQWSSPGDHDLEVVLGR